MTPKILSYNVTLETNLSYAHTYNRIIDNIKDYEWLYGEYGYVGPVRKNNRYTLVPCSRDPNGTPTQINALINDLKPDVLFMHEDLQRILWMKGVQNIPKVLWIPWDNEDFNILPSSEIDKCADVIVAVAKFAQKMMIDKGIECLQIYNPVDTNTYKPDKEAGLKFRKMLGIPEDHKVITWVGRPGWRKRFMHIVEIAARLNKLDDKIHLVLHTDFNDPDLGYRPEEFIYARDLLKGNVVMWPADLNFIKGYTGEMLNGLYNATDVYIAPHGGEGMGLPICEAMAAGKPFIATDFSTTQEFAGYEKRGGEMHGPRGIGAKIGYIFKDKGIMRPYVDIDDFVQKTLFLLNNPDLRDKMGKEGRKWVLQNCSCEVVGAQWKDILDKVCKVNTLGFK